MTEYYELKKVTIEPPKEGEFRIVNASLLTCSLCGTMIDGMGGHSGAVCIKCAEVVLSGRMVGSIVWEENNDS